MPKARDRRAPERTPRRTSRQITKARSHISELNIVSFRGIKGLEVKELRKTNLFTGPNGIGKTSVAEALWLFNGRFIPHMSWAPIVQRWPTSGILVNPMTMLMNRNNGGEARIEIEAVEDGTIQKWSAEYRPESPYGPQNTGADDKTAPIRGVLRHEFEDDANGRQICNVKIRSNGETDASGHPPRSPEDRAGAVLIIPKLASEVQNDTIQYFSKILEAGRKNEVKEMLTIVMPIITNVEIATDETGQAYLLATSESGTRLPLGAMGDGISRLFNIAVRFQSVENGLMIVDEIEDGLYYKTLPDVWKKLRTAAEQYNVQIVATTHSKECVDAAYEAYKDDTEDIAVYGLYRNVPDGRVKAVSYRDEALEAAYEMNLEVR